MRLEFQSANGLRRIIGFPKDQKEAWEQIKAFLDEHNYKSYYTRTWKNEAGETVYDVGSWSEFFYLSEGNINKETKEESEMKGTVKWFNAQKGYGFIYDEGGKEYFVHYKDIALNGFKTLEDGEEVIFELGATEDGRTKAINVKPVKPRVPKEV